MIAKVLSPTHSAIGTAEFTVCPVTQRSAHATQSTYGSSSANEVVRQNDREGQGEEEIRREVRRIHVVHTFVSFKMEPLLPIPSPCQVRDSHNLALFNHAL